MEAQNRCLRVSQALKGALSLLAPQNWPSFRCPAANYGKAAGNKASKEKLPNVLFVCYRGSSWLTPRQNSLHGPIRAAGGAEHKVTNLGFFCSPAKMLWPQILVLT
jgi:hypothetical protein